MPLTHPPIPTELRPGLTDVEFALFYIAKRDASEIARQANRPNAGVSWSGMSGASDYEPKTYEQMLAEAEALVSARVQDRAVA